MKSSISKSQLGFLPSSMKLDTSSLEYFARHHGGAIDDLSLDLSATPLFDLTLGFIFKEGIIIAADSWASMGGYISSQYVKKIIEINPHMLGKMARGAAIANSGTEIWA